jgi:hypothetical protein
MDGWLEYTQAIDNWIGEYVHFTEMDGFTPLRCYFSVGFTQLMGTSQKFNSYPLGEIFQCSDKISTPNHKSQWFVTSIPN